MIRKGWHIVSLHNDLKYKVAEKGKGNTRDQSEPSKKPYGGNPAEESSWRQAVQVNNFDIIQKRWGPKLKDSPLISICIPTMKIYN